MKTLCCPVNGPRDIGEFAYGGVVAESPADDADTLVWANFVFMQDNVMGDVLEWWLHTPSGVWLIAERNTRTDAFGRVWLAADYLREARAADTPETADMPEAADLPKVADTPEAASMTSATGPEVQP